jgi:hypothetical protein
LYYFASGSQFLWAVYHKKIPSSVIGLDLSQDAKDWSKKIHLSNIVPVHLQMGSPPFVPPPQDQSSLIVGELRLLRDATERQHLCEISNDEEKKNSANGSEKLPEKVQLMVLRLSATSYEHLPSGPADSYLKVLKQSKAIGVATVLNLGLSMKSCQVEVPITV